MTEQPKPTRKPVTCSNCFRMGHNSRTCEVPQRTIPLTTTHSEGSIAASSPTTTITTTTSSSTTTTTTTTTTSTSNSGSSTPNISADARKAAKAAAAKKSKQDAIFTKYKIQDTPHGELLSPEPTAGHVANEYQQQCTTIIGSIRALLTAEVISIILTVVNENVENSAQQRCERELGSKWDDPKASKRLRVSSTEDMSVKPRKGWPAASPLQAPERERTVIEITRASTRNKRLRSGHRLLWTLVTEKEFFDYLAIILYSTHHHELEWCDYWREKGHLDQPLHQFVRAIMSRERFQLINSAFYLTDAKLQELETKLQEILQRVWVPASIAVVDESLVACKSRRNPHHVYIGRKPHPHGVKVYPTLMMLLLLRLCSIVVRN